MIQAKKHKIHFLFLPFLVLIRSECLTQKQRNVTQLGLQSFGPHGQSKPILLLAYAVDIPISRLNLTLSAEESIENHQPNSKHLTLSFSNGKIHFYGTVFPTLEEYEDFLSLLETLERKALEPYYITKPQIKKTLQLLRRQNNKIETKTINITESRAILGPNENVALFRINILNHSGNFINLLIEIIIDREVKIKNVRVLGLEVHNDGIEKLIGRLAFDRVFTNEKSVRNFLDVLEKYEHGEEDSLEEE